MKKILLTVIVAVSWLVAPAVADTGETAPLKQIMQRLNHDLASIAIGLFTDDFDRVAQGATGIAEHPHIAAPQAQRIAAELGDEMAVFKHLDHRVHHLAVKIAEAATRRDSAAAEAGYLEIVEGCLACHRRFKDRVAGALSKTGAP